MEPTGSEFRLLLLVLVVQRGCAGAAVPVRTQHGAHSLQCVFNISFNEQRQCMFEVFIGRTSILKYDCLNYSVIHEKQVVKTTNVWKDMKNSLNNVGQNMRMRVADLEARKICKDSSILQVRLECQSDASGSFSGSWEILLDGRRFLVFDLKSGEYKAGNSNCEEMKNEWENDEEVNEVKRFLKKISIGDCKGWLHDLDWNKVLGTTAAPATAPGAAWSKATANRPVTSLIPMILVCLIIGCVLLQ